MEAGSSICRDGEARAFVRGECLVSYRARRTGTAAAHEVATAMASAMRRGDVEDVIACLETLGLSVHRLQ